MTDKWNYNLDEAPRGENVMRKQPGPKGQEVEREVFIPAKIIACAGDGKTVTVTNWLPKQERWNFFASGEAPLCWQPWPDHPEARP